MSIRLIGVIVGAIAIAIGIGLELQGYVVASQCFLWSILAMTGPVGVAAVCGWELIEKWFWVAMSVAASLHAAVLWAYWQKLPFPTGFVPILYGFVEALLLVGISSLIRGHMIPGARR